MVFDGSEYVHMDCDSAEDHPVQHQVAPSRQPVREAISSASSTTSDSEQDIAKAIHPMQSRDRRSLPAAPEPKRAEVVSSDALDPYHNFTSAGSVPVRAHELETREAPVVKSEDRMEGFVSEGSVIKRSEEFGRPTEVREAPERKELTDFTSQGNVRERSEAFGKKPLEAISDEEEAKELTDFTSEGNVRERSAMFGRPTEVRETPEDAPETKELSGFASEGSVKERSAMFGRPTEVHEAIGDDEEEKQEVDEEELAAEQARVSQLPREQLRVYSYEELTVGVSGAGDG